MTEETGRGEMVLKPRVRLNSEVAVGLIWPNSIAFLSGCPSHSPYASSLMLQDNQIDRQANRNGVVTGTFVVCCSTRG